MLTAESQPADVGETSAAAPQVKEPRQSERPSSLEGRRPPDSSRAPRREVTDAEVSDPLKSKNVEHLEKHFSVSSPEKHPCVLKGQPSGAHFIVSMDTGSVAMEPELQA